MMRTNEQYRKTRRGLRPKGDVTATELKRRKAGGCVVDGRTAPQVGRISKI
jgi:hypothetical protein